MRCIAIITALLWLSAVEYVHAAEAVFINEHVAGSDSDADVRRALIVALQQKYPGVTNWSLSPTIGTIRLSEIIQTAPTSVEVLHAGARSALRVEWKQPGAATQIRTIWYDVKGSRPVVIAAREIISGAALSAAEVAEEDRDVVALGCAPILTGESLQGLRMRRTARVGQALCRESIEPRPVVARGDSVVVRYMSERISITTKGIAQQDAGIGQKLRVLNPMGRDSFVAVVTAANEVTVND